jgi:hypothetical protein
MFSGLPPKADLRDLPLRSATEQPTDLLFWLGDGACGAYRARVPATTKVSIGRTDSKRTLGFIASTGETRVDFVLNKDQVEELIAYLQIIQAGVLRPLGRKPDQLSLRKVNEQLHARRAATKFAVKRR